MLYELNNSELEQIARIYEMDSASLVERLQLEDEIIEVFPYEHGLKVKTKGEQNLILRFKNLPLNVGGA